MTWKIESLNLLNFQRVFTFDVKENKRKNVAVNLNFDDVLTLQMYYDVLIQNDRVM